jgi:hypothetical protein
MPRRTLTAAQLSAALQDANLALCEGFLDTLGPERCQILLKATLQLEAKGGALTSNGNRRRTPGGLFYKLAFACCPKRDRKRIWKRAPPPHTAEETDHNDAS